jgi:hypothetical protein
MGSRFRLMQRSKQMPGREGGQTQPPCLQAKAAGEGSGAEAGVGAGAQAARAKQGLWCTVRRESRRVAEAHWEGRACRSRSACGRAGSRRTAARRGPGERVCGVSASSNRRKGLDAGGGGLAPALQYARQLRGLSPDPGWVASPRCSQTQRGHERLERAKALGVRTLPLHRIWDWGLGQVLPWSRSRLQQVDSGGACRSEQ